jgi:hypothetical protein
MSLLQNARKIATTKVHSLNFFTLIFKKMKEKYSQIQEAEKRSHKCTNENKTQRTEIYILLLSVQIRPIRVIRVRWFYPYYPVHPVKKF